MKKSTFALMLGLSFLAQPFFFLGDMSQVQAAVRKNVSEYAGQRCNTPPRGSGIILGQYTGTTDNPILSMGGDDVTVSFFRCFTSMAECQGWLYTLRSKYTDGNSVLISCRKR
ncbi:metallophosphoesterase [Phyllobacterium endophyticum]|uniref:Metallophosphoesterase n=1 Tax=Phyllobacterium endophyticum TaxID=1149773 RepID=A0A2P7B223_9HYPH|nr:metallophosphoesterase [Phyllobacterium endophyticum]MBB3238085.1 hypothetical protein [Phyllobacterium endophyticum]PSH60494.1 metallophosphoesterase [Phyllobacterium endophyticum]TYR42670.1 metallophosphoesterase [Phyllobacterium endophyticum]